MTQRWSDTSQQMATFGWNGTTKTRHLTSRSLACGKQVPLLPPGTTGEESLGWACRLQRNTRSINGPDSAILVKRIELTIKL